MTMNQGMFNDMMAAFEGLTERLDRLIALMEEQAQNPMVIMVPEGARPEDFYPGLEGKPKAPETVVKQGKPKPKSYT
jgi:hypothetical protein